MEEVLGVTVVHSEGECVGENDTVAVRQREGLVERVMSEEGDTEGEELCEGEELRETDVVPELQMEEEKVGDGEAVTDALVEEVRQSVGEAVPLVGPDGEAEGEELCEGEGLKETDEVPELQMEEERVGDEEAVTDVLVEEVGHTVGEAVPLVGPDGEAEGEELCEGEGLKETDEVPELQMEEDRVGDREAVTDTVVDEVGHSVGEDVVLAVIVEERHKVEVEDRLSVPEGVKEGDAEGEGVAL